MIYTSIEPPSDSIRFSFRFTKLYIFLLRNYIHEIFSSVAIKKTELDFEQFPRSIDRINDAFGKNKADLLQI